MRSPFFQEARRRTALMIRTITFSRQAILWEMGNSEVGDNLKLLVLVLS